MDSEASSLPLRQRILLSAALYVSAMGVYFTAGSIARPPLLRIVTPLDDAIPFVPIAMLGYALAYVVPVVSPWLETTESGMRRLMRAVLLAYVIAAPFFVLVPVQDADPPLVPGNWVESLLEANRAVDRSKNAFPSMHVGLAVLLALVAWRRSRTWGLVLAGVAAVIAASTLLVKQHFLVDIPAGALVALAAFRLTYGKSDSSTS